MFEIVELDPATGDEEQLITTGTMAQMERELADILTEYELEESGYDYPTFRIQPAQ